METDGFVRGGEPGGAVGTPRGRLDGAWAAAAILALLSIVCCSPLFTAGWFVNQEEIRPIARALAAYHEIAAGDPYPRWISTAYLGKGAPLFDFYPPAFSFVVAYAHAVGVPLLLGAKLTLFLLFFVGALGVFLWVRPHLGHFPALVAGILYLFAPYHFLDVYVRGATAEFTALAALPFLFLAIDGLVDRLSARGLALLATASAAIVLSHFLGALMIAPFAAVYSLVRAMRSGGPWRALGGIASGGALGAALSAFSWLPALAEKGALSAERLRNTVSGYYSPFLHFVRPMQWIDPVWGFGPSVPEPFADGMSFQVGFLLLGSVGASVLLVRLLGKGERGVVLLALGLGCAATWLTSAAASACYAGFQPLQMVQFPWRFLGPATLFFSAAGAGFVRVLAERRRALGPTLAALSAALAVALSSSQRTVERPFPVADDRAAIEEVVAADPWLAKFGNEDEFLPKDAPVEAASTRPGGPFPFGIGVEISAVRAGRSEVTFDVASRIGQGIAIVPWHAFPGWKASLDGREWPLTPGPDGLIAFWVPQGEHVARVHFGTTRARVVGWSLCLAALGVIGALLLRERAVTRRAARTR